MNHKNYFLVLLLFMTSCAGNPWESAEITEVFVTDIKSSGLKIFNYSLTRVTVQNGGSERGSGNGKGSGKHGGHSGKNGSAYGGMGRGKSAEDSGIKLYFNEMLESKLKKTAYCRDGYIELDSFYGRGQLSIRGECEEAATEEDRIKFSRNLIN